MSVGHWMFVTTWVEGWKLVGKSYATQVRTFQLLIPVNPGLTYSSVILFKMEPETIQLVIIGVFVTTILLYFSTKPNFEILLLAMVVAAAIFIIRKRQTYSMEGV